MANDPDIAAKLTKEIERTGYPTELRISRVFESEGWTTIPNTYFVDKDEKKGREIDLVCWYTAGATAKSDDFNQVLLCMAVSIKQSSERPWVIFTSPKTIRDCRGGHFLTILNDAVDGHWPKMDHPKVHPIFRADRVGRTHYEGFSEGKQKGMITEAIFSCMKASVSEFEAMSKIYGRDKNHKQSFFFQSTVVLAGRLFECFSDESGKLTVSEIERIPFACHYNSLNYDKSQYLVDFVTMNGLKEFLAEQQEWARRLVQIAYS